MTNDRILASRDRLSLSRRAALRTLAASGAALAATPARAVERATLATAAPGVIGACANANVATSAVAGRLARVEDFSAEAACQVAPEAVEGPYFVCDDVVSARDIAGDRDGMPMTLAIRVLDRSCAPVPGAIVDVWQCDARGNYSGHDVDPDNLVVDRRLLAYGREPDLPSRFLRGVLATDADGIVEFDMIYPGYYDKRAVHTHYKVHLGNRPYATGQALYPEEINERVFRTAPYDAPRGAARVANADDPPGVGDVGRFDVVKRNGRLLSLLALGVTT